MAVKRYPLAYWCVLAVGALLPGLATAQVICPEDSTLAAYPPVVSLRVDNDLFANQDEGYTSGVMLSLVSPNLKDYVDDPCLPAPARWLNGYLQRIQPEGFDQQNMVVTVGQGIFTPGDHTRTDLINDDRPYAGALLVGFGYNARKENELRTTQLLVGMVGSASLAERAQNLIHDMVGADKFLGWGHQLRNEPVLNLVHERSRRQPAAPIGQGDLEWDAISHWGGAIGNLRTHANAGMEWRLGHQLPDDFGSSPVRPAGNNTSPTIGQRVMRGWSWHGFLAVDARWVLRDLTLDGNTFRTSHRVDKEPLVAEAAIGVAMTYGRTKFAFARYFHTREFVGQRNPPAFGSFTISRAF
ncbi:MAG TPA: lipid A deacylase LpxR family protein [Lysobacter sp.]|nr:lipid A deacylase LpxR family protein [Lysobacter sp.]